jgi:hypothetical protein
MQDGEPMIQSSKVEDANAAAGIQGAAAIFAKVTKLA